MSKRVTFNEEARKELKKGVDLIANAVKVTLGPRGRNVIYGFHYGYPVATKDGVTVARQVDHSDQLSQLGVLLVRQVAQKTADDAGDGTTTACVLAQAIFTEGLKVLGTGANPILIKKGIDNAVEQALKYVDEYSSKIEDADIIKVASLSANNDYKIGLLIKEAIDKVGQNGVITIEDNYQGIDTYIETVEGMQIGEGMLSLFFATDREKMICEYKNPRILIMDQHIRDIRPILPIMETVLAKEKQPLVIVAHGYDDMVMQSLVVNRMKQGLPILTVRCTGFASFRASLLEDIAILTGGKVAGSSVSLEGLELDDLGECEVIKSTKSHTTIIGGKGKKEEVELRIAQIEEEINKELSDYQKEKLAERLAKLTTGVAVIKVGAPTEVEVKEKKMRVEDALHATRASIEEGIVVGGGVTYLRVSEQIVVDNLATDEEKMGFRIVKEALRSVIKQIASNAGVDGSEIIAKLLMQSDSAVGHNFLTMKWENLYQTGVIDPAKVVKDAIRNSASVAGMLLTTEAVINEEIEDEITRTPKPRSE